MDRQLIASVLSPNTLKMSSLTQLVVLLSVASVFSTQLPPYSVISSKIFTPYSTYNLSIFVEKREQGSASAAEPLRFTATINSKAENYSSNQEISVRPGSTGILSIPVESLAEKSYSLTLKIKDAEGKEYENMTKIFPAKPDEIILIQTDKAVYEPGDTVRFRVVLLDAGWKPLDGRELKTVKISDAEGNGIKIWQNVTTTSLGIFKAELELSSESVLGEWRITAQVKPEQKMQKEFGGGPENGTPVEEKVDPPTHPSFSSDYLDYGDYTDWDDSPTSDVAVTGSVTFKVEQYVEPRFEVTLKSPPFFLFNDTKFPVQVQAKYTNSKGVSGQCTIRVTFTEYYSKASTATHISLQDGSAVAYVDLASLIKKFGSPSDTRVEFNASCTENATGITRNASVDVAIHRYPYRIQVLDAPKKFKPGLPFQVTIKVSTPDDKPVSDPSPNALKVSQRFNYPRPGERSFTSIPSDGIVTLTFQTPPDATDSGTVFLDYRGFSRMINVHEERLPNIEQAYFRLFRTPNSTEAIRAGDVFKVRVESSRPITSLNYVISNGKQVVASEKLTYEHRPRKNVRLKVICPLNAVPRASLLV